MKLEKIQISRLKSFLIAYQDFHTLDAAGQWSEEIEVEREIAEYSQECCLLLCWSATSDLERLAG